MFEYIRQHSNDQTWQAITPYQQHTVLWGYQDMTWRDAQSGHTWNTWHMDIHLWTGKHRQSYATLLAQAAASQTFSVIPHLEGRQFWSPTFPPISPISCTLNTWDISLPLPHPLICLWFWCQAGLSEGLRSLLPAKKGLERLFKQMFTNKSVCPKVKVSNSKPFDTRFIKSSEWSCWRHSSPQQLVAS